MSYEKPDGTIVRRGYGLFSREAHVNKTAFLIHHSNADVIVVNEETGVPVKAEYHFYDPEAADSDTSDEVEANTEAGSELAHYQKAYQELVNMNGAESYTGHLIRTEINRLKRETGND